MLRNRCASRTYVLGNHILIAEQGRLKAAQSTHRNEYLNASRGDQSCGNYFCQFQAEIVHVHAGWRVVDK